MTLPVGPATNSVPEGKRPCRARRLKVEPSVKLVEESDEQLAALAAREGSDGPAFVELVSRFRERVWRICYRLLGNEADAADAAQEVFVRLFVHRQRFAGRSKYGTWVYTIAVRTCLGQRRGRGRRQRHEGHAASEAQRRHEAGHVDASESRLSAETLELLDELSDEDRAMIILKYAEGYSFDELAEMFGLSTSACKMRVSRACQRLERRHGDAGPSGETAN